MGGSLRRFPLTALLILANLFLYLLAGWCGGAFGVIDNRTLVECGALYGPAVGAGEWWRLLSAMFLHGSAEHLALNTLSLFVVGRMMELAFRRSAYLAIYLVSGMTGFLVSLFVHPAAVVIGASGAIFGLFGAMGGFVLFHRRRLGERYRIFMKEFGAVLGLNLILGFVIPDIDLSAHLGGLVSGIIGGYLAIRSPGALWVFLAGSLAAALWIAAAWLPERYTVLSVPIQ
jgi:rhomboid protease GluP